LSGIETTCEVGSDYVGIQRLSHGDVGGALEGALVRRETLRSGQARQRFESPEVILERAASLNVRHSTQSAGDFGVRKILECARPAFLGLHFN